MEICENVLFRGISEFDCQRMIKCFKAVTSNYKSGDVIFNLADSSSKVGIMLSGRAFTVKYDINGNRTILEHLKKNDIVGEIYNYAATTRNDTEVICETDVSVMVIEYSELTKRCSNACARHTRLVENLLTLISQKAIALSERVDILSQRTIGEKLISYLQLIEDKTPEGVEPEIPFTTTALSDYLCVNRSALQREISRLSKENILEINKRKFKLLNRCQ